jgi:(1->4)-alpha-D-glucan 1-alpha-D-glucosylmutase
MEKAAREARQRTSWTRTEEAYEKALHAFADAVLADERFLSELEALLFLVVEPGRVGSLAQVLLKLTAPGIPDVYQGSELWDLSLVDPDNRRPVDFDLRRRLLDEVSLLGPEAAWSRVDEGVPKLWLIARALDLRRRRPEAFGEHAEYAPLEATGARRDHVVAYTRGGRVAAIVPRLVLNVGGRWEDTAITLPPGAWRDVLGGDALTGGPVEVARLFRRFPVALLASEAGSPTGTGGSGRAATTAG